MPFEIPPSLMKQIVDYVFKVPKGKVVSYGQIAAHLSLKDARQIGWAMHSTGSIPDFPWWRVVNNEGKITIKDPALGLRQKELLEAEGVPVNEAFVLDIDHYRYGEAPRQQRLV